MRTSSMAMTTSTASKLSRERSFAKEDEVETWKICKYWEKIEVNLYASKILPWRGRLSRIR